MELPETFLFLLRLVGVVGAVLDAPNKDDDMFMLNLGTLIDVDKAILLDSIKLLNSLLVESNVSLLKTSG